MNIIQRLGRAYKAASAAMRWPGAGSFASWIMPRSDIDYQTEVGTGRKSSVVMACVGWVMRTFPEAPVQVLRRNAEGAMEAVEQHKLLALLERPNPYYPGELLWQATMGDLETMGNAYWRKIRNGYGAPVQLWWMPQATTEPRWSQHGTDYISHYDYTVDGQTEHLAPEDVVHFRWGLDPENVRKGLAPLQSLWREVFTDDEAAAFSAALLKNMGVPGVILSPSGADLGTPGPNPDEQDAIKENFRQKFTGDKRGEPLVMEQPMNMQIVSLSPQQMDLGQLREIPEERVCAVMGIPAAVVGLGTGMQQTKVGATLRELRELAYESHIIPMQRLTGGQVESQLLVDFEDPAKAAIGFDDSKVRVLQEDEDAKWTRTDTAVRGGWMTILRAKEIVGETPEDGDNIYLRPINVVEVGPDAPEPELTEPTSDQGEIAPGDLRGEEEDEEPDDDGEDEGEKAAKSPGRGAAGAETARPFEGAATKTLCSDERIWAGKARYPDETKASNADRIYLQRTEREARSLAKRFQMDVSRALVKLADAVEITVREAAKEAVPKPDPDEAWATSMTLDGGEVVTVEVPEELLEQAGLRTLYEANYEQIINTTLGTVAQRLAMPVNVMLPDPVARDMIRQGGQRITRIGDQTRRAITGALADGRIAGDGAKALERRIRSYVEGRHMYPGIFARAEAAGRDGDRAARMYRGETIARTETKRAQNLSAIKSFQGNAQCSGIRVWDGEGCGWTFHDDPLVANGRLVSFQEAADQPLSHPRCVRSMGPVVKGEGPVAPAP